MNRWRYELQRFFCAPPQKKWESWTKFCLENYPKALIVSSLRSANDESVMARSGATHESWELVPLDELSLPGILQLWNQRFQVSGMQSPMSLGNLFP